MSKFFNFYDPLERRYIFNSFLVVVALVEVLIFLFTLIWQIDEGALGGPVKVVPFPWKEYLLAAFAAPIALVFLFGVIVRCFQALAPEEPSAAPGSQQKRVFRRLGFFAGAGILLASLAFLFFGGSIFAGLSRLLRGLGLAGTYLLVALLALACLCFPIRLILNYRLQKKALEIRYLQYLAERHGVVVTDLSEEIRGIGTGAGNCHSSGPAQESSEEPPS